MWPQPTTANWTVYVPGQGHGGGRDMRCTSPFSRAVLASPLSGQVASPARWKCSLRPFHPAGLPGRIAHDQGMAGTVFVTTAPVPMKANAPDVMPTDDGGIMPMLAPSPHPGPCVLVAAVHRTATHSEATFHTGIDAHVVLTFTLRPSFTPPPTTTFCRCSPSPIRSRACSVAEVPDVPAPRVQRPRR